MLGCKTWEGRNKEMDDNIFYECRELISKIGKWGVVGGYKFKLLNFPIN